MAIFGWIVYTVICLGIIALGLLFWSLSASFEKGLGVAGSTLLIIGGIGLWFSYKLSPFTIIVT